MKIIKTLKDINDKTVEGKLLIMALAKITTESQTDKTPDEVLKQVVTLAKNVYEEQIE